jgi:hypothetical protein
MIALLFLLISIIILFIWLGKRYWAIYTVIVTLLLSSATFLYDLSSILTLNL